MQNSKKTKTQKALLVAVTVIFILSSFYSSLLFKIKFANSGGLSPAELEDLNNLEGAQSAGQASFGTPVVDVSSKTDRVIQKILDELKAVFFKNVLGVLANTIAKQTAIWITNSGEGGDPMFIRNFDKFINKFSEGIMVDAAATIIKDLTGLDICTFDPRITINIVQNMPMFTEYVKPKPKCDWKMLIGHWQEIGQSQFITFNYNLSKGGEWGQAADKLDQSATKNEVLLIWDKLLENPYQLMVNIPCPDLPNDLTRMKCGRPAIKDTVDEAARKLNLTTMALAQDVDTMLSYATTDIKAILYPGDFLVNAQTINEIKTAWIKFLDEGNPAGTGRTYVNELISKWSACQNVDPMALAKDASNPCVELLQTQLGIVAPMQAELELAKDWHPELPQVWKSEVSAKVSYVVSILQTVNSGYTYLAEQINTKFTPEFLEGSVAYNENLAKDLFKPSASKFSAYNEIMKNIMSKGLSAYVNQQTTAMVNQGWKAATGKIYDMIETPASLISDTATEKLTKDDSYKQYTKSVAADAVGVFMHTLWNIMVVKLLEMLYPEAGDESAKQLAKRIKVADLPVTDDFYTPTIPLIVGIDDYINKVTEQYTFNYNLKDLDLLTDFQLFLSGEVKPNIYNNVIDSGLGMAITEKLTIKEALDKSRLQGNFGFSFGETAEPSAYNLANIKKLRKARVVPLGLELAAELIRDCAYRKNSDYADFHDLTAGSPYGYSLDSDPYNVQKLQNCLFKPYVISDDPNPSADDYLNIVREYNKGRLNQAVGATLSKVVDGFYQAGSGVCGDFDQAESPFCNLVDPNWVLKMPPTKCAAQTDLEPYGELLKTNESGQRYGRCTDFASCLQEDGKGGCVNEQYGFCAKEANAWQFGVTDCAEQWNSCATYTLPDEQKTPVSYLKNTLSGSDICGPDNAGCQWYSTNSSAGDVWHDYASLNKADCIMYGGTWLEDEGRCKAERIYLNNFAQTCDQSSEGCTEFFLVRDPANNLAGDSGFEYTLEGAVPQNWEVILKKEMIESDCQAQNGVFDKTCLNYNYDTEIICADNNGQWYVDGVCTDPTYLIESDCATNGAKWVNCLGAVNKTATSSDCAANQGDYKEYCQLNQLKYNLCQEPQFSEPTQCYDAGGTWVEECEITPAPAVPFTDKASCEAAKGSWKVSCQGAKIYNSSPAKCRALLGQWQGYGPFTDLAYVVKNGENTYEGAAKLQANVGQLYSDEQLLLKYTLKLPDATKDLTRPGDVYTASAYIQSNDILINQFGEEIPLNLSLVKTNAGNVEANSTYYYPTAFYSLAASTLVANTSGRELQIVISLPGGQRINNVVYIDAVNVNLNSIDQIRSSNLINSYRGYESNNNVYYKKPPPARLECHGYGPGDPPPVLSYTEKNPCEFNGGYWDQQTSGQGLFVAAKNAVCYQYAPDDAACANYLKVCEPEEAGCQIYTPVNGDPAIPGVVSITDYCPAECVGYQSYKQEPAFYDPDPDPLFHNFIADTASVCSYADVGCSQFTNLDEIARGGEGIEYYSYLKQCIKPNLGLGEKNFFTWQSSAGGPPQIVKYQFQSDLATGAPKTIDGTGDCLATLGEYDYNCLKFIDSTGREYYRDIRKTISVSENCHPYRKTESTEAVCVATNGSWQTDTTACNYNAIPGEGLACGAEANGCREFIGNRGNNVYVQIFDNFENTTGYLDWYIGDEGTNGSSLLIRSSESVVLGGHSLQFTPDPVNNVYSVHKPLDLQKGSLYTLSFWAKSDSNDETVTAKFSTATDDGKDSTLEEFATEDNKNIVLTSQWKNYNLGPVYVSWDNLAGNNLIFGSINSKSYFDNILLKVVTDSVYAVKNSWNTPASCDLNIYGLPDINNPHPMLGCQAYTDTAGQTHNLKSFTNLCRASSVGCQLLLDTKNSTNPNLEQFNDQNNTTLDDYEVPADELMSLVLDNNFSCKQEDKGCQKLGKPNYSGQTLAFSDSYLKNNPDKYIGLNAIMCNEEALGCTELINETGSSEYYKIEPNKLCEYGQKIINGQNVTGWFKKGSATNQGCAALPYENETDCTANGGLWSITYNQCTLEYELINEETYCLSKGGVWEPAGDVNGQCLTSPFAIYKNYQATGYRGYVGLCDGQYNGCTEFIDINPNFVFNGSFESADEYRNFSNWSTVLDASAGSQNIENTDVKIGNGTAKLIKRTSQACPSTYNNPNPGCGLSGTGVPNFGLKQTISRLAKGKTYKISFYYRTPLEAKGRGEDCTWPEAAFSFSRIVGNTVSYAEIHTYDPQKDWKKVEVLYTVPVGVCSDAAKLTKTECVAPAIWTEFEDLQDFELALYAPLALNSITNAGNCPEAFVLYDQIEVKDNTEDSYYVIDTGPNLDRSTCTSVNWDLGCVQFLNTLNDTYETIKVKKDRNCAEWAVCSSYCSDLQAPTESDCMYGNKTWDSTEGRCNLNLIKDDCDSPLIWDEEKQVCYDGTIEEDCGVGNKTWDSNLCTATKLCAQEQNNICQKIAPGKDNVRYNLSNQPIVVKRISSFEDKSGYIYRYGSGALSSLVQWRAGDYAGYTIADRYPLEKEAAKNFSSYPQDANLLGLEDQRYSSPICKVFPAEESPLPYPLSKVSNYKNLKSLYSQSASLRDIGNACAYEVASAANYTTYFPNNFSKTIENPAGGVKKICTSPLNMLGKDCTGDTAELELIECSGTGGTPICSDIEQVKAFIGQEGMCLESDFLNPILADIYLNYENIYKSCSISGYNNKADCESADPPGEWIGPDYQPYACLTYYPFVIDLCPYHKEEKGCKANPDCEWISPSTCQRKQLVSTP